MFTPLGRGGKTGHKEDIHKSWNTWDISLTHTHTHTEAHTLTEDLRTHSPVPLVHFLLPWFILRMWAVVFFNNDLCVEERATAEQSRTEVIAYQREVCSWGAMCTVAPVCPIFIKSVLCVPGVGAARCWTHFRHSIVRRHLTDFIISSNLFIYRPNLSSPQFLFPLFFIFER